jgi:hypothetical protein
LRHATRPRASAPPTSSRKHCLVENTSTAWVLNTTACTKPHRVLLPECLPVCGCEHCLFHAHSVMDAGWLSSCCRIDKAQVADATVRGGRARYINHCCDPNCRPKEFYGPDGVARMGIYAHRDIELGEELHYNYHASLSLQRLLGCAYTAPDLHLALFPANLVAPLQLCWVSQAQGQQHQRGCQQPAACASTVAHFCCFTQATLSPIPSVAVLSGVSAPAPCSLSLRMRTGACPATVEQPTAAAG